MKEQWEALRRDGIKEKIHEIFQEAKIVDEESKPDLKITCLYCLGIVFCPVVCKGCKTPYCLQCVWHHKNANNGKFKCPINCHSTEYDVGLSVHEWMNSKLKDV